MTMIANCGFDKLNHRVILLSVLIQKQPRLFRAKMRNGCRGLVCTRKRCDVEVFGGCAARNAFRAEFVRICESANLRICESANLRICEIIWAGLPLSSPFKENVALFSLTVFCMVNSIAQVAEIGKRKSKPPEGAAGAKARLDLRGNGEFLGKLLHLDEGQFGDGGYAFKRHSAVTNQIFCKFHVAFCSCFFTDFVSVFFKNPAHSTYPVTGVANLAEQIVLRDEDDVCFGKRVKIIVLFERVAVEHGKVVARISILWGILY